MDINQLKYFKTVADSGTITIAAQELFITPPAISSSIAALEQELNTKLFHRTGNRLILNRQGEIFLEYANLILNSVSDARNDLRESLEDRKNGVIIATTSANIFADLFSNFSIDHPEIPLTTSTVRPSDITFAGINSRFSFLFATEADTPAAYADECDSLCLFEDAPALLMHPDHPLTKKEIISPEELSGKTLLFPRINYGLKEFFPKCFDALFLQPPVFSCQNYFTAWAMVSKNAGVALVTAHSLNSTVKDLTLRPVALPDCRWRQMLYWRKKHLLTEEDLLFLSYVKNAFDLA